MSENTKSLDQNLPSKDLDDSVQPVTETIPESLDNEEEELLTTETFVSESTENPLKIPEIVEELEEELLTEETNVSESVKEEITRKFEPQTQTIVTEAKEQENTPTADEKQVDKLELRVAKLQQQKETLVSEIIGLTEKKNQLLSEQLTQVQETLQRMTVESLQQLEERKQALQIELEQLERRRERIQEEMRTSFAGVSQDLAIRVQGFKEYLVGSLQDLAAAAEQIELANFEKWETPKEPEKQPQLVRDEYQQSPQFAEREFKQEVKEIQKIIDQYRTRPDYYGPAWQLRRTFEPIHAERVRSWFFSSGGRGSIKTMGSRLQNILIASAVISVLHKLYGSRCRTLVLANTPERLGEWRRGLQDCLGISRSDFGPERGIVLFEAAEALVQKADRLVEEKQLPLVIIDETEGQISLGLLQFPLWLAFAPEPAQMSSYIY